MDFITIPTQGNATDFGDMTSARVNGGGLHQIQEELLLVVAPTGHTNTIQFITFSSTGDATDFGDLTSNRIWTQPGCSNQTSGYIGWRISNPS